MKQEAHMAAMLARTAAQILTEARCPVLAVRGVRAK